MGSRTVKNIPLAGDAAGSEGSELCFFLDEDSVVLGLLKHF